MAKKQDPNLPVSWQPRFGTRGMFLLILVVSVMAAAGYYLVQSLRGGRGSRLAFVLFTLAAPMLVMVTVSVIRLLLNGPRRRR